MICLQKPTHHPEPAVTTLFGVVPSLLLPIPLSGDLGFAHLALQLKYAVHQRFSSRGTSGDVNIDRDNAVAAPNDAVAVVVVTATICTGTHADNPARLRHLIVDLAQSWGHLVSQCARYNHDV